MEVPYKDPTKARQQIERIRERNAAFIQRHRDKPCARCKKRYPLICMDFHHRDPSRKLFSINTKGAATRGLTSIAAEIAKCDVLCSNCHRLVEAGL
jgi:hypothetical protein